MKSAERHKLETNELAHGLEVSLERYRPQIMKGVIAVVALIALLLVWSLVSGSSATKSSQAWDEFNGAVVSQSINVDQLRQSADASPGEAWSNMANLTWADSQVWQASLAYISNRTAADEALAKAASAYKSVIASSGDPELVGRAHLGLGRVYEMQDNLDAAKKEYLEVKGNYATYAKEQAERVASSETKETYAWLKTAKPPKPIAPLGPGVPGQGPAFSPGDLSLPPAGTGTTPPATDTRTESDRFDALFKDIQRNKDAAGKDDDRYNKTEDAGKTAPPAEGEKESPPPPLESKDAAEEKKDAAPPATPATPEKKDEK